MINQPENSCEALEVDRPEIKLRPLTINSWPSEEMHFGIGIQLTNAARRQFHTTAIYKMNGSLLIGDLQSHLAIGRIEAQVDENIQWIAPDLSVDDQKILAHKIDAWLIENPGKIPYSVAHNPGGVVWKENVWIGTEPGQGLTCATFIVELFKELGIPFISVDDWKKRPGDDEWAIGILKALSGQMSDEHVEAQKIRIGKTIRIRPSDVASAAHLLNKEMEEPLGFDEVNPLASVIELQLLKS